MAATMPARPMSASSADSSRASGATPYLSIIIPCYNEEQRIGPTLAAIERHLAGRDLSYELLVVDDGSTDGTADLVAARARLNGALRVIRTRPNRGKGHAVRTGALAARGEIIMFTDADLSIPITIVDDFLRAIRAGDDIVIASRSHPQSRQQVRPPLARRIMTHIFRRVVHLLLPVGGVRDTQCGCKAYRRAVARDLFSRQVIDGFSFDAEVLFLAHRAGYRVTEVPFVLVHSPASTVRPVRHALLMVRDLLTIRLNALRGRYGRRTEGLRSEDSVAR
jgi:dolichyl-phosphate beta-glucosyltransferase